jgi:PAS domain S-box-containing protein
MKKEKDMPRILIVDDEATITTQLEERLEWMGYKVLGSASSGEEAVRMAEMLRPDIILMDIVMPGKMDGIEAAEAIHKVLDIPIIFLTAHGDERFVDRAKKVDAMGYIIKPYQEDGLKAAVEIALYNAMIIRSIKDSELKWRLFAETISEGVILCSPSGGVFFWNQGAESIFGYTKEEAEGRPLSFILPEQGRTDLMREAEGVMAEGNRRGQWSERVGLRRDYSEFPLELSLFIYDIKGNPILVCLVRDISQRRRVEEGYHTALQERDLKIEQIGRQLENNLEMIYRLLSLQSDFGRMNRPLSAYKDACRTLREIMRADGLQPQQQADSRVDFSGYLVSLTDGLMKVLDVNPKNFSVTIQAEDIHLSLNKAISCGLIISEMLAAAMQRSTEADRPVNIQVELTADEKGRHTLTLADRGVGLPSLTADAYPLFSGMQVVQDQTKQLEAELVATAGDKTTIVLSFKDSE